MGNNLRYYIQIIKPKIILSNLISSIGGFILASKDSINYNLLISTLAGITLVIASSCAFNNYIDKDIDKNMERTKNRVLAKDLIPSVTFFVYATFLGIIGLIVLWFEVNHLSCWLGIIGFVIYVGIYSLCMKRYSTYSVLIGSLSGATPPVISYCSVTNKLDIGAIILLSIFILWQIPHSYAIAIYRLKDYKEANIPVLPLIKGITITKNYITLYIIAFTIATLILSISGYTGFKYLIVVTIMNICWLSIALSGYRKIVDNTNWARKLFIFSIITITSLSIMMSIDFVVLNTHTC